VLVNQPGGPLSASHSGPAGSEQRRN